MQDSSTTTPNSASFNSLSIVIPVFNEEASIEAILTKLKSIYPAVTIIVVNDGSTDNTLHILNAISGIQVISFHKNRGYGFALKKGMKAVNTEYLMWFDGDSEHRIEDIERFYVEICTKHADAVIGNRERVSRLRYKNRIFGKWLLRMAAQIVVREKISDLNCGLKCIRTSVIHNYLHLLPDGFPASDVTTIVLIKRGYLVRFLEIETDPRVGSASKIRIIRDGIKTLLAIINIFVLFDAFLFFATIGAVTIMGGSIYSIYKLIDVGQGMPIFGSLLLMCGVLLGAIGVVSSQISQLRLERFE